MDRKQMQYHLAGFTLIELMVTLAIVATLTLMVYPRYSLRIDDSKEAVLRENLRVVRSVIDDFRGDKGRYPENLDELVTQRYLRALPVDPMTESDSTWVIVEVPEGETGEVFSVRSGASGTARNGQAYADW
ncbi:prepilin-type N-terminal cleavage/methylation domain-containing protein [Comamonas testosteroni]|uniref:type II secretion system protein n=1 Tax=Comamonas testosteroni TaxID=285 RepID=UPI00265DE619|nr:prepilin-type N-terminal cleavage/methylation domain-containing protein [Comamonas testosteroni]WKL15220.1 prepilin-type N-terminal cleavage/methylation domain-containing protein [Comamonas testosteroni]